MGRYSRVMQPKTTARRWRRLAVAGLLLALSVLPLAHAQADRFDLAFCAPIGAWPMSDRDRPGFDNAIAEILADELGATATFTWTNFDDVGIRDTLHAGLCDVAIGIGEGVANVLSTVPYLKTPYVFVTRADRGLTFDSLDDPQLTTLTIGTYQAGVPSIALRNRGIEANVREYAALVRPTGQDDHTPILDAVLAGDVDVGIVYGPVAAGRALDEGGALALQAVTPELDFGATILQLSRIWTIGVRTHDEALRDRLNRALAERWDDVTAAMDAYGIPQLADLAPRGRRGRSRRHARRRHLPGHHPQIAAERPDRRPRTSGRGGRGERGGAPRGPGRAVRPAGRPRSDPRRRGARGASPRPGRGGRRARRRLRPAEATLLARIAADHDVAFFNVGSEDDALRDARCYPTTLHVAPSGRMLVAGIVATLAGGGRVPRLRGRRARHRDRGSRGGARRATRRGRRRVGGERVGGPWAVHLLPGVRRRSDARARRRSCS